MLTSNLNELIANTPAETAIENVFKAHFTQTAIIFTVLICTTLTLMYITSPNKKGGEKQC